MNCLTKWAPDFSKWYLDRFHSHINLNSEWASITKHFEILPVFPKIPILFQSPPLLNRLSLEPPFTSVTVIKIETRLSHIYVTAHYETIDYVAINPDPHALPKSGLLMYSTRITAAARLPRYQYLHRPLYLFTAYLLSGG